MHTLPSSKPAQSESLTQSQAPVAAGLPVPGLQAPLWQLSSVQPLLSQSHGAPFSAWVTWQTPVVVLQPRLRQAVLSPW